MAQPQHVAVQLQIMGIGPQRLMLLTGDGEKHVLKAGDTVPIDAVVGALNQLGTDGHGLVSTTTSTNPNGVDLITYWLRRPAR